MYSLEKIVQCYDEADNLHLQSSLAPLREILTESQKLQNQQVIATTSDKFCNNFEEKRKNKLAATFFDCLIFVFHTFLI